MRKTLLTLVALCLAVLSWGQDKTPFCCITQGAELTYSTLDPKGKETDQTITTIDNVIGANGWYEITQTSTVYTNGQPLMKPVTFKTQVADGNASIAVSGMGTIEVSSTTPIIPANLSEGLELGLGEVKVTVSGITTTQTITKNTCIARESLTTPAGTFDCFVVEQHSTVKLGPIKSQGVQKTWYVKGVGYVKMETYDKKGKLVSSSVLTSMK